MKHHSVSDLGTPLRQEGGIWRGRGKRTRWENVGGLARAGETVPQNQFSTVNKRICIVLNKR